MKYNEDVNINDVYNIKKEWNEIKSLVESIEDDFDLFLGHRRVKNKSGRIRKKIARMKQLLKSVSSNTLKTRQDYESDYS